MLCSVGQYQMRQQFHWNFVEKKLYYGKLFNSGRQ